MYGGLHPKSDVYRLYLKRKHGGRGLISIEMCVRLRRTIWVCTCVDRIKCFSKA